jgi:hypothetical protein
MDSLAHDYPAMLRREHEAPCLSLYQPKHRQHPGNVQEPRRLTGFVAGFGVARSAGRGVDDLDAIVRAAVAGRVETVLIEADRLIPG